MYINFWNGPTYFKKFISMRLFIIWSGEIGCSAEWSKYEGWDIAEMNKDVGVNEVVLGQQETALEVLADRADIASEYIADYRHRIATCQCPTTQPCPLP